MGAAQSRRVPAAGLRVAPREAHLVQATDHRIVYSGRVLADAAEGTVRFDWPATCIRFATAARSVWLRMDGGRNHFNLLIDGQRAAVLRTKSGTRDYLLTSQASRVPRTFEVQKRTEPRIASCVDAVLRRATEVVVVHGLVVDAESSLDILDEGPRPLLEFIGDSETCAFGNEGPSQPGAPGLKAMLTMQPAHQDASQSWPRFVADALGAECHIIAWSGIGVLWNCSPGCSADGTLQAVYPRLLATQGSSETTPSSAQNALAPWTPSAVVVFAGGNDWYTLVDRRSAGGEDELAAAFCAFLRQIRSLRQGVPIVILLASAGSMNACLGSAAEQAQFAQDMESCWRKAADEARDEKVFLERVSPEPRIELHSTSDWGQMGHFSVQGHRKWAAAVVPLVQRHLLPSKA